MFPNNQRVANNTSFCPKCLSQHCFPRTYIGRPIQTYIFISLFGENIFNFGRLQSFKELLIDI
jgi:hypothetical protein